MQISKTSVISKVKNKMDGTYHLTRKVQNEGSKEMLGLGYWENLNYKGLEHSENAKLLVLGGGVAS